MILNPLSPASFCICAYSTRLTGLVKSASWRATLQIT